MHIDHTYLYHKLYGHTSLLISFFACIDIKSNGFLFYPHMSKTLSISLLFENCGI